MLGTYCTRYKLVANFGIYSCLSRIKNKERFKVDRSVEGGLRLCINGLYLVDLCGTNCRLFFSPRTADY